MVVPFWDTHFSSWALDIVKYDCLTITLFVHQLVFFSLSFYKPVDKLAKSQCVSHSSRIRFAPNTPQLFDPSALIALVLQTANMHFLGITLCFGSLSTSEPSLLLRFSSLTIAENELCLVELQLTGNHWCSLPGIESSDIISPLEITEPKTMEAVTEKSSVNNEARFVVLCSVPRIRIALCTELDAVLRDNIASSTDCIWRFADNMTPPWVVSNFV